MGVPATRPRAVRWALVAPAAPETCIPPDLDAGLRTVVLALAFAEILGCDAPAPTPRLAKEAAGVRQPVDRPAARGARLAFPAVAYVTAAEGQLAPTRAVGNALADAGGRLGIGLGSRPKVPPVVRFAQVLRPAPFARARVVHRSPATIDGTTGVGEKMVGNPARSLGTPKTMACP